MPRRPASIGTSACIVGALTLGLTGCDRVFQLLSVEDVTRDAADASDAPDDATTDASSTTCLSDDFAAAAINGSIWAVQDAPPIATVSQAGGTLVVQLGVAAGVNYALIASSLRDLTHDAVSYEVIELPNAATDAESGLSLQLDTSHRYVQLITAGYLVMRVTTPDEGNLDMSIVYSAQDHRFLRLRNAGNDMLWETSPDRITWTVRRTEALTVDITNLAVELFGGTFQQESAAPGRARFDNLQIDCLP